MTTVMSFTPYQRQWCALINMHRLSVARQLLYPVGGRYFGASGGTSQPSRGEMWEEGGAGGSGKVRGMCVGMYVLYYAIVWVLACWASVMRYACVVCVYVCV